MKTKVCPACNSQNVELSIAHPATIQSGGLVFECKNCGYAGSMTVMPKAEASKL